MRNLRFHWLACLLAIAAPATAQPPGTLPEWGRALTPAEGRELRAEVGRLSRRLGVREETLIAIARVLGANLRDVGFLELIQRVQSQAERAAELQVQIGALQAQIEALADAAVRNPAEQALGRALTAFQEGRLDDADREFGALESLRRSESESAHAAWIDAVDARARVAELRLDYDAAESLRLSAAREEQSATRLSIERQWRFIMAAAYARYDQGQISGDAAALERAISLYRNEALPLAPRAERPDAWAGTQNDLGNALQALGEMEAGSARLEQAVVAFELALLERTRARVPLAWAGLLSNLGSALFQLGTRERGTTRLRRSVRALQTALEELPREQFPLDWARNQSNLANALAALGARENGTARIEQAIQIYEAALEELSREQVPLAWAMAQNNVATALMTLGDRENDVARLEQAVAAYQAVLQEWTRDRFPIQWAMAQNNLGIALQGLGRREAGTARLEQAVRAHAAALEEVTRERVPAIWAATMANMADAMARISERTRDRALLDQAEARARDARAVFQAGNYESGLAWANYVLRRIASIRRRMGDR